MSNTKKTIKIFKKALFNPDNKLALIPNWLSFSRTIGSYLIPILIYTEASVSALFPVVGFIALSDFLDGKLARLFKVESEEGALIDVVSDKFFSINLTLGLLPKAPIYAINGILESTIAYINSKALSDGKKPKSNFLGKVKVWPLSIGLGLGYLSIAMKTQGNSLINPNDLMTISTMFSIATIPLELINIKQYKQAAKKKNEEKLEEKNQAKINEKEKTNKKRHKKQNKLLLDKSKNIKAMVYEPKKEDLKIKGKQKRL